ncbi:glycosyltransferase [Aeromonas bestiarum]|jgi:glycosyltransferase involved in cell wall biosynthesis|uniref:glycosyltransferase n=1 Tax=Aeromonas bestiarum TaxID=105751 RepID=UPI0032B13B87
MKKILFIVEDLYGGGAEKVLLNTASLLQGAGAHIIVYTLRDNVEHSIPDNIKPINIAIVNRLTKSISNLFIEKIQAFFLHRKILRESPDVIISCSCDKITRHLPSNLNIYYWIHGNVTGFAEKNEKSYAKFKRFYNGRNLICVSHGIADDILKNVKATPKSCKVIYNPFDVAKIQAMANEDIKVPFEKYFIHIGSFEERKRHDRLLQAYKLSDIDTPLVLMGKGPLRQNIEVLIKELDLTSKVIIIDFQKNPYPYIKFAQALVLTSDAEGLPTVLIEALICHTQVISVDCPSGPSEILTGELQKYLCPMNDVQMLAKFLVSADKKTIDIDHNVYQIFSSEETIKHFMML